MMKQSVPLLDVRRKHTEGGAAEELVRAKSPRTGENVEPPVAAASGGSASAAPSVAVPVSESGLKKPKQPSNLNSDERLQLKNMSIMFQVHDRNIKALEATTFRTFILPSASDPIDQGGCEKTEFKTRAREAGEKFDETGMQQMVWRGIVHVKTELEGSGSSAVVASMR